MTPQDREPNVDTARALASRIDGTGDHVWVGLHGWNGSRDSFAPLRRRIDGRARLLSLDLPGYGASPPPRRWSLDAIGAQIAATVDGLVPEGPISLIGSCSGGVIGLFVAPLLEERLSRFVFLEPFAYVPAYLGLFTTPIVGPICYYSAFGNPIGRFITNKSLGRHRGEETDMTASFERGSLRVPLAYLRLFDAIDRPESFADLPGQIELIYGEHTFAAISESVDIWSEVWPRAKRCEIAGAGHLLLQEAPEKVANAVFEENQTVRK